MAKPIAKSVNKQSLSPPWQQSEPVYTVGKACVDGMDHVAQIFERKWGVGRLRLLVSADLRAKFDSQVQRVNKAMWHGELHEVQTETQRMINAWKKLDHVAEVEVGAEKLSPVVWEAKMDDGRVLAFVRTSEEAWRIHQEGRNVTTYSMDQVVAILAENERRALEENVGRDMHRRIDETCQAIHDRSGAWNDQIPFAPEVR